MILRRWKTSSFDILKGKILEEWGAEVGKGFQEALAIITAVYLDKLLWSR